MDWVYRRNVGWKWFRGEKQDRQGLEEKGGMDWVLRENKIKTREEIVLRGQGQDGLFEILDLRIRINPGIL